jgi:hypothetical protein
VGFPLPEDAPIRPPERSLEELREVAAEWSLHRDLQLPRWASTMLRQLADRVIDQGRQIEELRSLLGAQGVAI